MSLLKTVGVIGTISGIGLIGYYLLNKYKPTIAQTQINDIKGQGYVLRLDTPENRKLWSIVAQYGYDNLGKNQAYLDLKNQILTQKPLIFDEVQYLNLIRFYSDMNDKGVFEKIIGSNLAKIDSQKYWFEKRTQGLADEKFGFDKFGNGLGYQTNCEYNPSKGEVNPCGYNYSKPFPFPFDINQSGDTAYNRWLFDYYTKYAIDESKPYFRTPPNPSGKDISILAENCVELDMGMKKLIDRIAEQTKNEPDENHRRVLAWYKDILEDYFQIHNCRNKIEKERLSQSAKEETLFSIKAENSVLGSNQKEQNIYLGIGALVLVLSAGILTYNAKSNSTSVASSPKGYSGLLSDFIIIGGLSGMGYLIFKKPKVKTTN